VAGYHIVKQGDCLSSIARMYGFIQYAVIWNRPENAELRARCKSPNTLRPGDRLFVPDLDSRIEDCATDNSHQFVAQKKHPILLEIMMQLDQEPVANAAYTLEIGGLTLFGKTQANGCLKQEIPPDAARAHLHFEKPELDWDLELGGLDPSQDTSGNQQRLNNLGFFCGPPDGALGPRARGALRRFQKSRKLPITGELDSGTKETLRLAHDGG
jgi:hypothetical protein